MTPMSSARRRSMAAAIAFALVSSILALVAAPAGAEAFDTSSEPPTANAVPKVQEIAKNVPPATGWYVNRRDSSAGLEVLHIRRDEPLARGTVAVLPRSGLYRLRTALHSETLIGGHGRAPTPKHTPR